MIGMQGRGRGRLTFVAEAAESSERPPGHGDAGGRWRRAIAPRHPKLVYVQLHSWPMHEGAAEHMNLP